MDTAEIELLAGNPWVQRRKITADEYHQMGETGILTPGDRVELIDGEIVAMSPIGTEHNGAVGWLTRALVRAVGDHAVVLVQGSIRLNDQTEPQPDFAVLRPREDDYRKALARPEDVLLLIEIADSSLRYDRSVKRPLYAMHGITEYWLVNLQDQNVEVCRTPTRHGYASVTLIGRDGILTPERLPGLSISVAALLG